MVRAYVPLEGARILDIGCGIGTYVKRFRAFSDEVYGVDVEPDRVEEASRSLPNISLAPGEALPFPDGFFDLVFSNEVIEHVADDRRTAVEAVRVTRPGGAIVLFAPNRLYPFETHGAYFGRRYVFGNVPLVNWLPDPLRDRLAPHVRAYTQRGLRSLFRGLPVRVVRHRVIYPGFDNISGRHRRFGAVLRRGLYAAERTPLHTFGLSHFLVLRKLEA
jgi:SAM-dependent methyltransferase